MYCFYLWIVSVAFVNSQVDVNWLPYQYMTAGKLNVVTNGAPYSSNKNNSQYLQPTYTFTVTFALTFKNIPLICFGVTSLELKPATSGTKFFFRNQIDNNTLSKTYYNHLISLASSNYIQTLVVSYFATDAKYATFLDIQYFTVDPSSSSDVDYVTKYISSGSGYRKNVFVGISQTAMISNHIYGQLIWLQSIGLTIGADGLFQIGMSLVPLTPTTYNITFWTDGNCKITYVEPNFINFDQTQIEESKNNFIDFGFVEARNGSQLNPELVDVVKKVDEGFLIGVFYIRLYTLSGQLDFSIDDEVPFPISTLSNFSIVNYTYFNFRVRECPTDHPYYYETKELCYAKCPDETYLNQTYSFCFLCGYTCLTCPNATFCQTCDPLTFRNLTTNYKCQCIQGYYDSGQPECSPCIKGCLTCTNSSTCTKCNATGGYKLSSKICVCSTGYYDNGNGSCNSCSSQMFGCGVCSSSDSCSGCLTPTQNYEYTEDELCKCQAGYYEIGNICGTCAQKIIGCLNCASSTQCLQCDQSNNFTLNSNSTCSCPDTYYIDSIKLSCSLCSSVIGGCSSCSDKSTCTLCSDSFVLQNSTCFCTNISQYLQNGVCSPCNSSCLTCNGPLSNNCLTCQQWMIRDQILNTCNCTNSSYVNTGFACASCSQLCSSNNCTNSSSTGCIACSCPCLNGFYLNSNKTCSICDYTNLKSSSTSCTCPPTMYTQTGNNSCNTCYYTCVTCLGAGDLSNNNCSSCDSDWFREKNGTNCSCVELYSDENKTMLCIKSACTDGKSFNSNNVCQVICGDGLVGEGQECDDQNVVSDDGCSSLCKVQNGFTCSGNQTNKSQCTFNTPLSLDLISLIKDPSSNTLIYSLNISPATQQLTNANFSQMINLNLPPSSIITYTYDSNGTLTIKVNYFQPLTNYNSTITFNPSNYSSIFNTTPESTLQVPIQPSNNLAAEVYSQQVYDQLSLLKLLAMVTYALALVTAIIGLFGGKLVAIEMLGIVQLGYIGLLLVSLSDPLYYSMSLIFTNGYSLKLDGSSLVNFPSRLSSMSYYQTFINNFNIMLAPELILFILWMITKIISKFIKPDEKSILINSIASRAIGEYTLTFVLFSLYQYIISVAILFSYKAQYSSSLFQIGSYVEAGVFGGFAVGISVLYFVFSEDYFGEYKEFFHPTKFSQNFYYFHIGQRIVIGVALAMGNGLFYSGIVGVAYLTLMLILTAACRPYKEMKHNIRNILNNIFGIGILGIYTYVSFKGRNSNNDFAIYLPYIIIGLLLLTALIAICYIAFQIIMKVKDICDKKKKISMPSDDVAAVIANEQEQFDNMIKERMRKESENIANKRRKRSTTSKMSVATKASANDVSGNVDDITSPTKLRSRLLSMQGDFSPQRKRSSFIEEQNMVVEDQMQNEVEIDSSRSFIPLNAEKGNQKSQEPKQQTKQEQLPLQKKEEPALIETQKIQKQNKEQ